MKIKLIKLLLSLLLSTFFISNICAKAHLLFPQKIEATSYLLEDENQIFHPYKLYDQDEKTSYSEGVRGSGIHSEVIFYFNSPLQLKSIELFNGFQESDELFKLNNRIKELKIIAYENSKIIHEESIQLKDIKEKQNFNLKIKTKNINIIKIVIVDVYKGSKYNDTCLSEINFFGYSKNKELYESTNMENFNVEEVIRKYMIIKDNSFLFHSGPMYAAEFKFKKNRLQYHFALAAAGPDYNNYIYSFSITENHLYLYPQFYYHEEERYLKKGKFTKKELDTPLNIIRLELIEMDNDKIKIKLLSKNNVMQDMFNELLKSAAFFDQEGKYKETEWQKNLENSIMIFKNRKTFK